MVKSIAVVGVLVLLAGFTRAEVTFEFLFDNARAENVSAEGSVVVGEIYGNDEAFRWTVQTGLVPLGMSAGDVLGRSAGKPAVSHDGLAVAATILGADSTCLTQGIRTEATGWIETMPPPPSGSGILDDVYGSRWAFNLRSFMITLGAPADAPVRPRSLRRCTSFPTRRRALPVSRSTCGGAVEVCSPFSPSKAAPSAGSPPASSSRDETGRHGTAATSTARAPAGPHYTRLDVGDTRPTPSRTLRPTSARSPA